MSVLPDRIRWYEDMLVTPQHVEQLSLRLERLVQTLPGRYSAYPYGVAHVDLVLDEGLLAVRSLDAVMPNGLHVSIGADDPALQFDVRPYVRRSSPKRFLVHLAAPLDLPDDEGFARFVAGERPDGLVGDDGRPVERKGSRLTLFAGDAPSELRHTSFPVLEVSAEGIHPVATDFLPPLLQVPPEHPLALRCAAVADRLRREVTVLASRSNDEAPIPFRAEVRAQINPVVAVLPPFEVLVASQPHPFVLYLELCRVAAAAAALRDRVVPPSFPRYSHQDVRGTFEPVFRFVLGADRPQPAETPASFEFERDGVWFRLPPDQAWSDALVPDSPVHVIMALQADTTETQGHQWGEQCVIASRSVIQSLLARRMLGLVRRRVHAIGAQPVERDVYVFRLESDADVVKPGEDLLVLGDLPGVTPLSLTLHVVNPEGDRRWQTTGS